MVKINREKKVQDIEGNPGFTEAEKKIEIQKLSPISEIKEKATVAIKKSLKKIKLTK